MTHASNEQIFQDAQHRTIAIDGDTTVMEGTGEAALRGAGAVCAAVDAVMAGEAANAFCNVRPPGHHAEPDKAKYAVIFRHFSSTLSCFVDTAQCA